MTARRYRVVIAVLDALLIGACALVALYLRLSVPWFDPAQDPDALLMPAVGPVIALWLVTLWASGAYRPRQWGSGVEEYRQVLNGSLMCFTAVSATAFLLRFPLSRGFIFVLFLVGLPVLLLGRFVVRRVVQRIRASGRATTPVLIAGAKPVMGDIVAVLSRERWLGYRPIGVLTVGNEEPHTDIDLPVVGNVNDVLEAVDSTGAQAVIFGAGSFRRGTDFNQMARQLESHAAQMIVVPALTDISAQRIKVLPVAGLPLMLVEKPRAEGALSRSKRVFDIVVAGLVFVLVSPVMLITALAVKLGDGGPVIFRQQRVGRGGKVFECLKFRSMVMHADKIREQSLNALNESDGALFKIKKDPRITRVGKFIRRFSIDELPQLVNVLKGDMSLVGPRPALEQEVVTYKSHVRRRLDVRPGMTGLWQVSGRSDLSWDDTVRLDLYYVDNWSLVQDLAILAKTARAVFSSRGAY